MALATGALMTASTPAVAAVGVPQVLIDGSPSVGQESVVLSSMGPLSVPLNLPRVTIPADPAGTTYRPSGTIGLRWRACRYPSMRANNVDVDCFWIASDANADGSAAQMSVVQWQQVGGTWQGAPGTAVTLNPRNLPMSGAGLFLAPYVRVYSVASGGGLPIPGMDAEFGPGIGATLVPIRGPTPTSALPASPVVGLTTSALSAEGTVDLTVLQALANFMPAQGVEVSTRRVSLLAVLGCLPGLDVASYGENGLVTGNAALSGGTPGPPQGAEPLCTGVTVNVPGAEADLFAPSLLVTRAVPVRDLLPVPLGPGQAVDLDLYPYQQAILFQGTPQDYSAIWHATRVGLPRRVTVTAAGEVPAAGAGQPIADAGAPPAELAGVPVDASPAGQLAAIGATVAGIDVGRSPIVGTSGSGSRDGRSLAVRVPRVQKRGHGIRLKAYLSPSAKGTVRFVLTRVLPSGRAVVGKVKSASVRRGKALSGWILRRSKPAGSYTVFATFVPRSPNVAGMTVWLPIRVR